MLGDWPPQIFPPSRIPNWCELVPTGGAEPGEPRVPRAACEPNPTRPSAAPPNPPPPGPRFSISFCVQGVLPKSGG